MRSFELLTYFTKAKADEQVILVQKFVVVEKIMISDIRKYKYIAGGGAREPEEQKVKAVV